MVDRLGLIKPEFTEKLKCHSINGMLGEGEQRIVVVRLGRGDVVGPQVMVCFMI